MRLLSILLLLFISTALTAQKTTPNRTFDLKDALEQKLISLDVEGIGGHQGESLKLLIKNIAGRYIRVRVPLGQLMEPSDSALQTLVIAEEQLVSVNSKTEKEVRLKTFCTQSGDISPQAGSGFAVGSLAATQLCSLLKYIADNNKTEDYDAQSAVWCVMNKGRGLGGISDRTLAKFTADLLGKELPGYKIRYETVEEVPGRRAELGKAMVVEGNFRYYLEKDEKTVMVLLDGEGKLIKQISKEQVMVAGEHRSSMRLEVYNLDPGKYIVRMQTKAGKVIKDMEVEF